MLELRTKLVALATVLSSAPMMLAQSWTEVGDARSFPDGSPQITRGSGALVTISGTTGTGDLRDSFCLKIVDPTEFLATTDPATMNSAGADFDTRLFLFRRDQAPVLANDDTPPSAAPFLSTLTNVATDGSGFVLTKPGEYVLVVGGFQDNPDDFLFVDLFALGAPFDLVRSANPAAGSFASWSASTAATGSYTVGLAGVEPCQGDLDLSFANGSHAGEACLGDGTGGFDCAQFGTGDYVAALATGFLDGDAHPDVVLTQLGPSNDICLGTGAGAFTSCTTVASTDGSTNAVALAFLDGDANLDAVFSKSDLDAASQVCFGDGVGDFSSCVAVGPAATIPRGVAAGFLDFDANLDLVFANDGQANLICLGTGTGTFDCSNALGDVRLSEAVALGFVDGDGHLDAVFANDSSANQVCLGDSSGTFGCTDVGGAADVSKSVALGFLDGDANLDAVFGNRGSRNRSCLGNGSGGFSSCTDVSDHEGATEGVTLGLIDEDPFLDAVFANLDQPNRVCFGDGSGGFSSCSAASGALESEGVVIGEFTSGMIFADGFESGSSLAWSSSTGSSAPALEHRWSFTTGGGDSVGGAHALFPNGAFVENGVVQLDGVDQYVELPIQSTLSSLTNCTIEAWITLDSISTWVRIFDFGSSTAVNFFATPSGGAGVLRSAITVSGQPGEEVLDGTFPLSVGVATHFAITINAATNTAVLYVDGAEVGSANWTLDPAALGALTNIWLGRSQYSDPFLDGYYDEFRIYSEALTEQEIADSFNTGPDSL